MARFFDVFFDVNRTVAEGFFGFVAGDMVFFSEGDVVVRDTHAASAPASNGFDDYGISDFTGNLNGFGFVFDRAVRAGNGGHAGFFNRILGDCFISHHFYRLRFRSNKLDVTRFTLLGKFGIFREKTIARVDSINVGDFRCCNDTISF